MDKEQILIADKILYHLAGEKRIMHSNEFFDLFDEQEFALTHITLKILSDLGLAEIDTDQLGYGSIRITSEGYKAKTIGVESYLEKKDETEKQDDELKRSTISANKKAERLFYWNIFFFIINGLLAIYNIIFD